MIGTRRTRSATAAAASKTSDSFLTTKSSATVSTIDAEDAGQSHSDVTQPRKRSRTWKNIKREATVHDDLGSLDEDNDTQRILREPSRLTATTSVQKTKGKPVAIDPTSFLPRVDSKWKVGAHVSAAGGVENAVLNARAIGANAFALFLKSQRKWSSPPLSQTSIDMFNRRMKEFGFDKGLVLPHGSYLVNLGNPDDAKRRKSYDCFVDDLRRCASLDLQLYNLHPGSTVNQTTPSNSLALIAGCINRAHQEPGTGSVKVVLECMAGSGSVLGSTFEQLAQIIEGVEEKQRVGVCFDTCHAFSAGYDFRTEEGWQETVQKFDEIIGLKYLSGMHLNDSKTEFGSRKDRHENIGMGTLGLSTFAHILSDPRVQGIPLILETPSFEKPREVWGTELAVLNQLSGIKRCDNVGGGEGGGSGDSRMADSGSRMLGEAQLDLEDLGNEVRKAVGTAKGPLESKRGAKGKDKAVKGKTVSAQSKARKGGVGKRKRKLREDEDSSDNDESGDGDYEEGCSH